jgi:hypothetical protein
VEKGGQMVFSATKVSDMKYTLSRVTSDPTLLFRLLRRKGNYLFRMTLFDGLSAENASKPKMEFNGQPIRLIAATKLVLEAEVPAKTLKDGLNEVPKRHACWRYNWPRCLSLRPWLLTIESSSGPTLPFVSLVASGDDAALQRAQSRGCQS